MESQTIKIELTDNETKKVRDIINKAIKRYVGEDNYYYRCFYIDDSIVVNEYYDHDKPADNEINYTNYNGINDNYKL
jgi:hypothetical protein